MSIETNAQQIERDLTREQIIEHLEGAGFACYDHETTGELAYALAEHCATEAIDIHSLAA